MNKKQLQAMARELAKDIKTGEDLSTLSAELTKLTVEAALNAELENHLGYSRQASVNRWQWVLELLNEFALWFLARIYFWLHSFASLFPNPPG